MARTQKKTGSTQTSSEQSVGDALGAALVAIKERQKTTLQRMAQAAGVSTATLLSVLKREFGPQSGTTTDRPTGKQVQGWAEALARLTEFARENAGNSAAAPALPDVLKQHGLRGLLDKDGRLLDNVVDDAVDRVLRRRAVQRGQSDPVLDTIAARREYTPSGRATVRPGYLLWEPFVGPSEKESIERSWAGRFTTRLVAAVNPVDWDIAPPTPLTTIDRALDALWGGVDRCDLVFGLYDTPYRRLSGSTFVRLPGLGVPLGALSRRVDQVSWDDVFWPSSKPGRPEPLALVLRHEVGHLYLRGPCQFNPANIVEVPESSDPVHLLREFLRRFGPRPVILVADAITCEAVQRELSDKRTLARLGQELNRTLPQMQSMAAEVTELPTNHNDGRLPVYRVGWAIRNDGKRWQELLEIALREELFGSAVGLTAAEYARLIQLSAKLECIPFEEDLPSHTANRFRVQLQKTIKALPQETRNTLESRCAGWLSSPSDTSAGCQSGARNQAEAPRSNNAFTAQGTNP